MNRTDEGDQERHRKGKRKQEGRKITKETEEKGAGEKRGERVESRTGRGCGHIGRSGGRKRGEGQSNSQEPIKEKQRGGEEDKSGRRPEGKDEDGSRSKGTKRGENQTLAGERAARWKENLG